MERGREEFPAVNRAETQEDQENRVALLKEELNTVLELNAALEDRVKLLREELDIKTQLQGREALDNAPQKLSLKDRFRRTRLSHAVGAIAAAGALLAAGAALNDSSERPVKQSGPVAELNIGEKPDNDSNTHRIVNNHNEHKVNIGNAETINQAKRNAGVNTKEEFDWLVNDMQKYPGKYDDLKVTSRDSAGGSFLYGGKFSVEEAIKKNQWRELSAFAMGIANDQAIARSAANMSEGKPCDAERNDSFSQQRSKGLLYLDSLKSARLVILEDGIVNTFRSGGNIYTQREDEAMVAIELTASTTGNGQLVDRSYIKQGGGESGNDCDNCLVITPDTNITIPPETKPPETQPPETQPPETKPPETQPPETQPPETVPPKHDDGILPGDPSVPADQDPGTPDVPGEGPAGQIPDDTGYVPGENVPPAPTPPETTAPEPAPTPTPTPPETVPAPPAPEPPASGGTPTNPTGPSLPN